MTVRDSRRNEDYFREYIQTQKGRIARFEEVFQKFQPPEDAQKMEQCAVSLGNFYRDLFCAQYSAGEQKTVLRETYVRWLAYIRCLNAVPWSDAVDLLSLALLLGEAVDETLSFPWEDALVRRLAGKSGGEVKFGKAVPFLRCLDGADGPEGCGSTSGTAGTRIVGTLPGTARQNGRIPPTAAIGASQARLWSG